MATEATAEVKVVEAEGRSVAMQIEDPDRCCSQSGNRSIGRMPIQNRCYDRVTRIQSAVKYTRPSPYLASGT